MEWSAELEAFVVAFDNKWPGPICITRTMGQNKDKELERQKNGRRVLGVAKQVASHVTLARRLRRASKGILVM